MILRKSVLLFLFAVFSLTLAAPYLEVIQQEVTPQGATQKVTLLQLDLAEDTTWHLLWNHSVTGITVSDYYAYREGQMMLTDSHTPSFDAGLGHIPGRGRLESDDAHGYWIRDIDEPVIGNAYALRVGYEEVDHRIVHAGQVYSLSDVAAGERVTIRIKP